MFRNFLYILIAISFFVVLVLSVRFLFSFIPDNLSYLLLLSPIILIDLLLIILFRDVIKQNKKTIIATVAFFALPWYFTVDILAVRIWKIWFYNTDKILGVWLFGTTLEEFLWTIIVSFLMSVLAIIFTEKTYLSRLINRA